MDIREEPSISTEPALMPRASISLPTGFPFSGSFTLPSGFPFDGSTPTITVPSISTPNITGVSTATGDSGSSNTPITTTITRAGQTGAFVIATAATSSQNAATNGSRGGGLSAGAAAGIGVGCTVVVLTLLGLGFWLFLRRRRRRRQTEPLPIEHSPGGELGGHEVAAKRAEADPTAQVYESAAKDVSEMDGYGKQKKNGDSHEMPGDLHKIAELPGSIPGTEKE